MLMASSLALGLAGCAGLRSPSPKSIDASKRGNVPSLPPAGSGRGGYYQDDGPGDTPPPDLQSIPNAEPKIEPYSKRANRPYVVFGTTFTPITDERPMKQRGIGSWYGKKFHGQKTSSGEPYDMYKMTAAHPTLPLPSYARVTNVANGNQVIVRVNDRGPFHSGRIIDLSYTAAFKLGYLGRGSGELEVERILPEEIERMQTGQRLGSPATPVASAEFDAANPANRSAATPLGAPVNVVSLPVVSPPTVPPTSVTPTSSSAPPATLSLEDFLASQPDHQELQQPSQPLQPDLPVPVGDVLPASSGGFYLQMGAFTQSANAEMMRERLGQTWPLTLPPLATQQRGAVYRLYSGPFETREAALRAAAMLADNPLVKPLIVQP